MGEYEDTLKDIKSTFGIVPGFMKKLPKNALVKDWPLLKKYSLGESNIPANYRELMGLTAEADIECQYCQQCTEE